MQTRYLACVNMKSGAAAPLAGIVDPDCDVAQICRETAMHVQEITEDWVTMRSVIGASIVMGVPRSSLLGNPQVGTKFDGHH